MRVEIPRQVSEFRKTENVLRQIVNNAVAHHTTMPLRFATDSLPDRRARNQAILDTVLANHISDAQDLNNVFADCMFMAMPAGFCPAHVYWRDTPVSGYEPAAYVQAFGGAVPGELDCWVGNPFDTVFDRGAKKGSIHWASYGRVLPAELVRQGFKAVPAAAKIEGTNRMPSASQFQRIARSWNLGGLGLHGTPIVGYRKEVDDYDELVLLLCREVLPGVDPDWPNGRLQIVAVPGATDLRLGQGDANNAILLADQDLPAGDFSFELFYSDQRADDVHGRAWIDDLDELQVSLNIALSRRWEFAIRGMESPIVVPAGVIDDDMMDIGGLNVLEMEMTQGGFQPKVMEWPSYVSQLLDKEVEDKRRAIYTGGGFQAVSRGEAPGTRTAYRAIVALQQADNTIHGPVNLRFKRSACSFMQKCWKQFKAYATVPWLVTVTGDEYAYLAEPYIDNSKLSSTPPNYKLVNAFGASPELRAQEILELMAIRGADGQPFMTTEEARRQYPNPLIFDSIGSPKVIQRRRAKTIQVSILHLAAKFREQTGMSETSIAHPWVQQAGQMVFQTIESQFPRLQDDDLESHINSLTEITQDETADPVARVAAIERQKLFFLWQSMMAGQVPGVQPGAPVGHQPQIGPGQQPKQLGPGAPTIDHRGVAGEMQSGGARQSQPDQGPHTGVVATARG